MRVRRDDAFERIYDEHSLLVYNFLRQQLANSQDAEDATVETFRRVQAGLKGFRNECSVRVWVMRIASNVAIRLKQREAKHRHGSLEELEVEQLCESKNGSVEKIIADRQVLEQILAEIPPMQRNAVWLRVAIEYTDEEVAQILNVPVGTVKSWVWRTMARLRKTNLTQEREELEG